MVHEYDYLIVGAGLFGAVFAYEMKKQGKKVLVIDKRNHIGGNLYTYKENDIVIHKYGPHVFHTNDKRLWDYVTQFIDLKPHTPNLIANYENKLYHLPFNMNTFYELFNTITPKEAKEKIESECTSYNPPKNLEEWCLNNVGKTIYETLIKGYTEKQWDKPCKELPASIIKRLPLRYVFDNNYFNDTYSGIPFEGYDELFAKLLEDIPVVLNTDFLDDKEKWMNISDKILFTGPIDRFYDYCFGRLEYRSVNFIKSYHDTAYYQGTSIMNYTSKDVPWTRCVEYKCFQDIGTGNTIIVHEYPCANEDEPYYPVNTSENNERYKKYYDKSLKESKLIFGGRLGLYEYLDMDTTLQKALELVEKEVEQ